MHVIVGICTWNRAGLLSRTLRSLEQLLIPSGITWEVLVADNNSTDRTAEVVDSFRTRLPISRLFVPQQGKSHALNAAVAAMRGDLLLWTDDDVEVVPHWLKAYVFTASLHPHASFFGGPIEPVFLEQPPDWVAGGWDTLKGPYGERELGDEVFAFTSGNLPFGANWAVWLDVQKRYAYDTRLGRVGNLMLAGEETDLGERLLADGLCGLWTPQARVAHLVTPERVTVEFVERYFFGGGQSCLPKATDSAYRKAKLAVRCWLKAVRYEFDRTRSLRRKRSARRWVHYTAKAAFYWGRLQALGYGAWFPGPIERYLKNREQPRTTLEPVLPSATPSITVEESQVLSFRIPRSALVKRPVAA